MKDQPKPHHCKIDYDPDTDQVIFTVTENANQPKPASGEWTYDQVDDLFSALGIMGIVQCHNAALSAEREKVTGLHEACRSEANHSRQLREQLAAERERFMQAYRDATDAALAKMDTRHWIRAEDNPGYNRYE